MMKKTNWILPLVFGLLFITVIISVSVPATASFGVPTTPKPTVPSTATPAPSATVTPTASATWVPYLPAANQVTIIPVLDQSLVYVDITFPSSGYRVADPGQVAVAAGINPDGTTYLSNITTLTKIEQYTGYHSMVLTTIRTTYQIHTGDTTYFAFRVNYYGSEQKVKDITIGQNSTPTPAPVTPTITPAPTATPTAISTPSPTPIAPGGITVQMFNSNRSATLNMIYAQLKIINQTGTNTIDLSSFKIRYYYTIDGVKPQNFWCDYSTVGSANVTGSFISMATPKTGADYYLEIGFTSGAGTLAPGASFELQIRFAKNDWSNYIQTNDYSFNATATGYADWSKVTDYVSGTLWWGVEP